MRFSLVMGAVLLAVLMGGSVAAAANPPVFEKCAPGQPNTEDQTCVVDGDTIWLDGVNIRMEGYDTPEPQTNICGGEREKELTRQVPTGSPAAQHERMGALPVRRTRKLRP